jgi:two-component system, OmpR family, aerobic respiration control sensor histidine kinase ArcB
MKATKMKTASDILEKDATTDSYVEQLEKTIQRQQQEIACLKNVIECLPGNIYWKDRQGTYLGGNAYPNKKSGDVKPQVHFSEQTVTGKNDYDFFPKAVAEQYRKNDIDVMENQKELTLEESAILPNGDAIIQLSTKRPLYNESGQVVGVVGSNVDISDLKEREKSLIEKRDSAIHDLEYIISKMPGYIYWKNTRSEYMGCNERLAKASNLETPSDIMGKTDYDFEWGKDQAAQFVEDDKYIMRTGESLVTEYELPQTREDGKNLYIRTDKMPFYDNNGKIIGLLAIAIDITDQKELERILIEEKNKAEQANLVKTEFIRNMEHDIRTPFSGVWGMANYLWEQEENAARKEYLGYITQCAKELLDYCNGILDFSRIESGLLAVVDKKFELEKVVDSVINIEYPIAIHKKLELRTDYDKDIPKVLLGDRYRIYRMLLNLLSNAIKFTEEGHVELKVCLLNKTEKSALVRFIVEDTGIGIPDSKQEYIFEKFSRLSLSNKGIYKGIGLGLRVVKQFMHEIGGEIDVISEVGKGTQFICTIPFDIPLTNDFVEE